jgi:hypothetical protein
MRCSASSRKSEQDIAMLWMMHLYTAKRKMRRAMRTRVQNKLQVRPGHRPQRLEIQKPVMIKRSRRRMEKSDWIIIKFRVYLSGEGEFVVACGQKG